MIKIKTREEIEIMAQAGRILAEIMKELEAKVKPGIGTKDLDKAAERLVLRYGAKPSFKNYQNFPATICACVNEELVHCVPSARKLKQGDILSIDIGLCYKGYNSDMAVTVPVGEISPEALRLLKVTKKALKRGIKKVRPGITFGDIGNTIQRYVEGQGYSVIRDLTGHGIGKEVHEEPEIPNYGKRKTGPVIKEGMVFCIEPMVAVGDWHIKKAQDGYGFQTKDNSLSAHFEHTVAVFKDRCRVLTK
jgi:methionyl aminopeptidase